MHRCGAHDVNKFVEPRPYADTEAAARKLLEFAHAFERIKEAGFISRQLTARCCSRERRRRPTQGRPRLRHRKGLARTG